MLVCKFLNEREFFQFDFCQKQQHKICQFKKRVNDVRVCVCMLSCVWLFANPWTVALQAPLSMEFPRQEYWSSLPFPSPEDLPDPGFEPMYLVSPALAGNSLPLCPNVRVLQAKYILMSMWLNQIYDSLPMRIRSEVSRGKSPTPTRSAKLNCWDTCFMHTGSQVFHWSM